MPFPSDSSSDVSSPQRGGVFATVLTVISIVGERWLRFQASVGGVSYLLLDSCLWVWRAGTDRNVRIGRLAIVSQVVRLGVRAIAIVSLLAGCIGAILALQMAAPLEDFGQVDKIANIIGFTVLRELGPLIAAVILTGFAGAAVAAEIGTMVVGEEIEALEVHALNPIRFLVVPRILATALSVLCLTIFSDIAALLAGMAVSVFVHNVPARLYIENTIFQCAYLDIVTGLIKGIVFGLLIGVIACYNGLRVTGGAAGVGRATTDTVVASVVSVIFADLVFTIVFYSFGWN